MSNNDNKINFSILNYNEIVYNKLRDSNKEYIKNQCVIFVQCIDSISKIHNYIYAIEYVSEDLNISYSIVRCPASESEINRYKSLSDTFIHETVIHLLKERHNKYNEEPINREINTKESTAK